VAPPRLSSCAPAMRALVTDHFGPGWFRGLREVILTLCVRAPRTVCCGWRIIVTHPTTRMVCFFSLSAGTTPFSYTSPGPRSFLCPRGKGRVLFFCFVAADSIVVAGFFGLLACVFFFRLGYQGGCCFGRLAGWRPGVVVLSLLRTVCPT